MNKIQSNTNNGGVTKQELSDWYARVKSSSNVGEAEKQAFLQATRNLSDSIGDDTGPAAENT